jgi:hypothetical protein
MRKIITTVIVAVLSVGIATFGASTLIFNFFPLGFILAVLLIALSAHWIKASYGRRLLVLFSVIEIIIVLFLCGIGPFGSDILFMANALGYSWMAVGSLIGPVLLFVNIPFLQNKVKE